MMGYLWKAPGAAGSLGGGYSRRRRNGHVVALQAGFGLRLAEEPCYGHAPAFGVARLADTLLSQLRGAQQARPRCSVYVRLSYAVVRIAC